MKKQLVFIVICLLGTITIAAQGIYNNGGKIIVRSGATVYLNGSTGNLRNETNGGDGAVLLSGTLRLEGNLTNNAVSAGIFTSPAAGSEVILNGSAAQSLDGSSTATFDFDKLTLNNSSGVTMGSSAQVNNLLNFQSGIITTGSNILTVGSSGSISGASSSGYVSGKLARSIGATGSDVVFPLGKGGKYRPLSVNFSSLSGTSTVLAEQIEALLPGDPPVNVTFFSDRYWQISQTGGSDMTFTLSLNAEGLTSSSIKKMIKGDGSANTDYDVTYSSPNYTNTAPFSSFSNFGLGEYCVGQVVLFEAIAAKTWGDEPFTVSATGGASGNVVVFTSSDPAVATCTGTNGTTITILKAGSCTISATQAGNETYCQGRTNRLLTINPKPIVITANAGQTKVYGSTDPTSFTYSLSPSLLGADAIAGAMERTAGENAGDYTLKAGTLDAGSNYALSLGGTPVFTVSPKPLTPVVTASAKCFDGTASAILTSQTLTGVITPDEVTLLVGTSTFDNAASGNEKTVTVNGLTLGGASAANYALATSTATATAEIFALPFPTISGYATSCVGSTMNVFSTETGKSNYLWTVSAGGTITSGGGTSDNTVTVTWNTIGAQTVSVIYTDAHSCTAGVATVKNVTVVSLPVPTLSGAATACINHTNNTYTTEAGNTNYVWTISPGGTVTAGGTSSDNSVTVTWTRTGSQYVSVNYTVGSSCSAENSTEKLVTVSPSPTPTVSGPASVCSGTTGHVYTTQEGMSAYNWTVSEGGTITSGGGSASNTATVTWNTAGDQSVSVNYQNADGCQGASEAIQNVTVKASPVPTITGTSPVCGNMTPVNYTTQSGKSNYAWTLSSGGSISSESDPNTIAITWSTPGMHTITANYMDANGCLATTPSEKVVSVGTLPVVTLTGPATACVTHPGKVYTTESGQNNYTWTVSPGGTVTARGTSSDNTVTVTWNRAGAQYVNVNYQNENGCSASSETVKNVTAIAAPDPTISGPASVCSGTSGNVYTTEAGQSSYLWTVSEGGTITSGGGSADNTATVTWNTAGAQTVSVNYQNSSGCQGASAALQGVTVNVSGQVNRPGAQVLCGGMATAAVNFETVNTGGETVYNWTNSATGIGLAPSGTGNIASFVAVNNGTSPVVATISVTPTFAKDGNSCSGSATTFTITVNPAAQVNQPASQVLCNGSATSLGFITANTGGTTTYAWTNSNPDIGLAASGTCSIPVFTAVNQGTAPVSATITVTPTFSNGGDGCSGPSKTFEITVDPSGQAKAIGSQLLCSGSATSAVNFETLNTGGETTYTWTNSKSSIGLPASGSGNIASFTAVNSGTAPVTATIAVTPYYSNNGVTCEGGSKIFTITVNPAAQVNQPANLTLCNGSGSSVAFATANIGGTTTYAWSNSNTAVGLAASGIGNIPAFIAINAGTAPATATITVTPTYANGGVTCEGPAKSFTVTINPTAQVSQPASQMICSGSSSAAANFETANTGGIITYNWTNSVAAIGLSASGTGNIASFKAVNNGTSAMVATIRVTPVYTKDGVSCSGAVKTFTITVNPVPAAATVSDRA
ncbi:MAG: YDG domain-containing protein, partial [Prolixibacteraceae bacterium]